MLDTQTIRALIVEDEALVSDMLWGMLESAGYRVAGAASTGQQALALAQSLRPEVVLLDINLPDLDGLEVARRLMADCPTPVVIVTAHETSALVKKAGAAGVGAFLTKPPSLRELDRAIQITLARFADLQALRASEEKYRAVFAAEGDALFLVDQATGELLDVNASACQLYGYDRAEMLQLKNTDMSAEPEATTQATQTPQRAIPLRYHRKKDGTVFPVDISASTLTLDGRTVILAACRDITERVQQVDEIQRLNASLEQRVAARTAELHQANQALTAALRVKDEFLATMSHELRTPLTSVLGLAEALQLGVYGPLVEKQVKVLATIQTSAQHLVHLITDVLDFVQAEAGGLPSDVGLVDVTEVCQTCLSKTRATARKKDVRLTLEVDTAVTWLHTDGRHLLRMLTHLLDNAVKFTPGGGAAGLIVALAESAGPAPRPEVHLTVWDTGPGIDPAHQSRIFEPFTQLDSRLARKYEGTGLGLALVRRLAQQHGGDVQVASTGVPGEGSRFTLCLPLA